MGGGGPPRRPGPRGRQAGGTGAARPGWARGLPPPPPPNNNTPLPAGRGAAASGRGAAHGRRGSAELPPSSPVTIGARPQPPERLQGAGRSAPPPLAFGAAWRRSAWPPHQYGPTGGSAEVRGAPGARSGADTHGRSGRMKTDLGPPQAARRLPLPLPFTPTTWRPGGDGRRAARREGEAAPSGAEPPLPGPGRALPAAPFPPRPRRTRTAPARERSAGGHGPCPAPSCASPRGCRRSPARPGLGWGQAWAQGPRAFSVAPSPAGLVGRRPYSAPRCCHQRSLG